MNPETDPVGMGWQMFLAAGFAVACLGAMILASLAAWIGRRGEAASGPRWGATLGLGLGAIVSHEVVREAFVDERPSQVWDSMRLWWRDGGAFPLFPVDAFHWIPWVVLGATLLGLFDGDRPAPRWARWENRALLVGLLLWLLLGPLIGATWETRVGLAWMLGLGVGILAWWAILDARAEGLGPAIVPVVLIPAAGLPAALMLAHAAILAAIAAGFAAVLASVWIVSWANRRMSLGRGAIPVFAVAFAGLTLCGTFYNDMPKPVGVLLGLAPLASIIDRVGPVSRLARWEVAAVRLAAVAILVGVALGWAFATAPEPIPM